MAGNSYKILSVVVMLSLLSSTAMAQFYQRKDTVAVILKRGVVLERNSASQSVEKIKKKNKKEVRKTSKKTGRSVARKAKAKPVKNNKDTATVRKNKSKVVFEGTKYRLGDRVIMRGDSGTDVKSLANILVKKLFLDENDIIYTSDGGALYDGAIIKAVRSFQKVSGIYEDGTVATTTLKALRKRNKY